MIAICEQELPNAEYGNCQAVSKWRQPGRAAAAQWFAEPDGLRQGRFLGKSKEPNQPLIANASR
jgi:hypothetical protein